MATEALFAHGTLLKIGDGATPTESFATIAEVTSLKGPSVKLNTSDATHHGSAGWMDKIATLLEGGTVEVEVNWLPTNATHDGDTGFLASLLDKRKTNFELVFPSTPTLTAEFAAFVVSFEPDAPPTDKLSNAFGLEITGAVTFTEGA